ncbi:hypothetical protein D9M68_588530 [compost metagenome]
MAAGHGADLEGVDAGHLAGDDDRDAQGAEGHRRGVGDQAQPRRIERVEAKADEQGGGNGHRRAEAGRALQEGTEGEADQQYLQALVVGDGQHRAADHLELAALDREFVEEHRRDDDPGDRPETVGEAVAGGGEGHVGGHLEGEDGDRDRQRQGDGAGDVAFHAEHCQGQEEEHDGDQCDERRQSEAAEGGIELLPGLHLGVAP